MKFDISLFHPVYLRLISPRAGFFFALNDCAFKGKVAEGTMYKLKLNLPPYRLSVNVHVVKRRGFSWKKMIRSSLKQLRKTDLKEVKSYVRRAFAHKNIKKVLGTNLALMVVATSFIPTNGLANAATADVVISEKETVLKTERAAQFPVETVKITQGYRVFHPGIDLDGVTGDAIRPVKNGRVKEVSYSRFAYGNAILVDHGNEVASLYAHLSEIDVEPNQEVTTETVIGEMGATGRAFGDHLHLEIYQDGRAVNPLAVLPR